MYREAFFATDENSFRLISAFFCLSSMQFKPSKGNQKYLSQNLGNQFCAQPYAKLNGGSKLLLHNNRILDWFSKESKLFLNVTYRAVLRINTFKNY